MFNPWWLFIKGISIKHFEGPGKEILALRMITFIYSHLHELNRSVELGTTMDLLFYLKIIFGEKPVLMST